VKKNSNGCQSDRHVHGFANEIATAASVITSRRRNPARAASAAAPLPRRAIHRSSSRWKPIMTKPM
jgi:hypothetical protein